MYPCRAKESPPSFRKCGLIAKKKGDMTNSTVIATLLVVIPLYYKATGWGGINRAKVAHHRSLVRRLQIVIFLIVTYGQLYSNY